MPVTSGINHIAMLTTDLDRFIAFYVDLFDADVTLDQDEGGLRHAMIDLGGGACLHPFQIEGNPYSAGSAAMFARGHLDHIAVNVADEETFEMLRRRLHEVGASDGTITDFGFVWTVSFTDPDGFEAEIALYRGAAPLTYVERKQYPLTAP